jgi:hypothetical protein
MQPTGDLSLPATGPAQDQFPTLRDDFSIILGGMGKPEPLKVKMWPGHF